MFSVTYRSTGPVPEYPEMIGYMGRYETDDPAIFGDLLTEIEERPEITVISIEYNGREVPPFGPL